MVTHNESETLRLALYSGSGIVALIVAILVPRLLYALKLKLLGLRSNV